jgi:signal transduction histidine kinase
MGVGLLSRFIGAVFLVLLAGLLLLDQTLLRANRDQGQIDAASAAVLAQSFVSARVVLLDRIVEAVQREAPADSAAMRVALERAIQGPTLVNAVWVADSTGRAVITVWTTGSRATAIPAALTKGSPRGHAPRQTLVEVTGVDGKAGWITLVRGLTAPTGASAGVAGLIVDGDSLRALLARVEPGASRSLLVLSGLDTVVRLGDLGRSSRADVTTAATAIVRLPDGGTWSVVATHTLTSRWIRWGLWSCGVLGVLFLAIGLLREQQRALQVADRSVELERLYSDVKRANQAKSEFLANVSHELRTPLNAIVGFVELLRDGFYGDLSPRQIPPVDRIAASATHLRHLVDQVLDIAKIAAGRLEVHAETIVLRPFVLNVASELESLVSEKGLAFSITVGASLPRVRTDPTHLRQILINLIGNAVKYTPAGTVSVRARLLGGPPTTNARMTPARSAIVGADDVSARTLLARAPRSGTWVVLQVVDSGVGIAPSDLERIFDEFEQVNAGPRGDSMQRGTGLGLAISRRLARLLGGDVSVESELGRGSTFTVWLPVNPADLTRERSAATGAGVTAEGIDETARS